MPDGMRKNRRAKDGGNDERGIHLEGGRLQAKAVKDSGKKIRLFCIPSLDITLA